ncbi:MAG: YraN family protein [Planctomycetota bacterium]
MTRRAPPSALRRALLRHPRIFVSLFEPDDGELGALGEEVAARHLDRLGWRILARRLETRAGEADLLVRRGGTLAVVEVKTGRVSPTPRPAGRPLPEDFGLRWRPGFRCDARRLARLRRVACAVSRWESSRQAETRVDLVEVLLSERPRRFRVIHHEDLRAPLA